MTASMPEYTIDDAADVVTDTGYLLNFASNTLVIMKVLAHQASILAAVISILAGISHIYAANSAKRKKNIKRALGAMEMAFSIPALAAGIAGALVALNVITLTLILSAASAAAWLALSWGIAFKALFDLYQVEKKLDVHYLIEDRLIKHENLNLKIFDLEEESHHLSIKLKNKILVNEKLKDPLSYWEEIKLENKKREVDKKIGKYKQQQKVLLNQAGSLFRCNQEKLDKNFSKKIGPFLESKTNIKNVQAHDQALSEHLIKKQNDKHNKYLARTMLATVAALGMTAIICSPFLPAIIPVLPAIIAGVGAFMVFTVGVFAAVYLFNKLVLNPLEAALLIKNKRHELATSAENVSQKAGGKIAPALTSATPDGQEKIVSTVTSSTPDGQEKVSSTMSSPAPDTEEKIIQEALGLDPNINLRELLSEKDRVAIVRGEAGKKLNLFTEAKKKVKEVTSNTIRRVGIFSKSNLGKTEFDPETEGNSPARKKMG